ncbi:MAG: low molecular weight phosphotyrosine protein phosphatase [Burkholderiales bacterium]|nr:low molecular weight phosphotyrosine protein phosphatase [Burkholderiales bacterium]
MTRVLFVCTGNICRSPTAEGVFLHMIHRAGLHQFIQVDSAGTHGYHVGDRPDPRSLAVAARRAYDLSRLRARRLRAEDYGRFDHLLAMDRGHLSIMLRDSPPEHRDKIRLFMDFAPQLEHREVPDPYYGDNSGFELVLDLVEAAAHGLLQRVHADLGSAARKD